MSDPLAVSIDDLTFAYDPGDDVLSKICIEIAMGERVALIGHNGSGKTTLAKHLNGLLRPSRGRILIQGEDTAGVPVSKLAAKTALLFQNPDDQICRPTVREEVAFGPENLGYFPDRTDRLVGDTLSWFDLLPRIRCNPHDLGYSSRKRLALASVMAMDTPVVVLDEPTAGLDASEIRLLVRAMDRLTALGKTIIVISHDMDFVAEQIPRAVCLSGGRKVFDGSTRALFPDVTLMAESALLPPQAVRLSTRLGQFPPALTPEKIAGRLPASGSEV